MVKKEKRKCVYQCSKYRLYMSVYINKLHSQSEDLVPFWVEVFVDSVSLQPIVAQLHHTEGVTLSWREQE